MANPKRVIDEIVDRLAQSERGSYDLTIIKRTQGENYSYYGKFYIPPDKRHLNKNYPYRVEALKTVDLEEARQKAFDRYLHIKSLLNDSIPIISPTITEVFEEFMLDFKQRVDVKQPGHSIHQYRGFNKSVKRYWLEYLSENGVIYIDEIRYKHFEDYDLWRRRYWTREGERRLKFNGNVKIHPTDATIKWDINMFKMFLKWAKTHNRMTAEIPAFTIKRVIKNSRRAFTREQWDRLTDFMRSNIFHSYALKHGTDKRVERSRNNLRAFILLLGHTGMRPGEALKLRWKDFNPKLTETDKGWAGEIVVSATHSKVRKFRRLLVNPVGVRALERLIEQRSDNLKPDDFIFCDEDGRKLENMRDAFNNLMLHSEIGLDADGNKFVPYCCRHFYITMAIERGSDVYKLAKQCGTSVEMIGQYYDATLPKDHIDNLMVGLRF